MGVVIPAMAANSTPIQQIVCSRRDGLRAGGNLQRRPGTGFETFCMELNEHFCPGSYLLLRNQSGSHPWRHRPNPVIHFPLERRCSTGCSLQATFPDTTTPDQMATTSAGELQAAIWWLEGEGN